MKRIIILLTASLFVLVSMGQSQPKMKLWYNHEARLFEESLPIGNGKLGALVYGGAEDNLVYLNDITMWVGKPVDQNEGQGLSVWVPKIREALFREDYRLADSLQHYLQGHFCQPYQPLATLHLYDWNQGSVKQYRRELCLDSAYIRDCFIRNGVTYTREYIASHPDKLIAIRLKASKPKAINCQLTLGGQVPHKVKGQGSQLVVTGHATGDAQESIHFCTILRVAETDGEVVANDEGLTLRHATEATVYIVNETSFNGPRRHPVTEGAPYMEQAADDAWHTVNTTYDEVRQRHIQDYQQYYDRVKLCLGRPQNTDIDTPTDSLLRRGHSSYLETLYFQFGRYLLISSSRTKGVPANLQGLWTPHLWSPWNGNYTLNINLEENYWPAFVTNLSEMADPLDDFIAALADNGQHTARNFYGVNQGWCASHNSDIWAMSNPVGQQHDRPMWANWNMGGAWLVNTLWERYQFTQDKDYLHRVAYPLMKGAADFCLGWLIENPKKKGELITAPSTSPENEYVTPDGYVGATHYGGTADMAIIRELLLNTIAAGKLCGDKVANYEKALKKLHPYTIGSQGDLNEWYYDWRDNEPRHRHQSHLIGLYPGQQPMSDAEKAACRQTLIQKGDQTTGWSTGWRINLWARLHDAEQAYHIYQKLLNYVDGEHYKGADKRHGGGTYSNLFDAHPPFQIDGNFGGTAGVCEMLMQSHAAKGSACIELLPALPTAWKEGAVRGLRARGGYEVSMTWHDAKVTTLTVKALKAGTVTLLYNGKREQLKLKAGEEATR